MQDHVRLLELKDGYFDSQTTPSLWNIYQAKKIPVITCRDTPVFLQQLHIHK